MADNAACPECGQTRPPSTGVCPSCAAGDRSGNQQASDDSLRRWTVVSAVSIMLFVTGVVAVFLSAALSGRSSLTTVAGAVAAAGFAGMVAGKVGSLWASRR